jgi:hypothetical protein
MGIESASEAWEANLKTKKHDESVRSAYARFGDIFAHQLVDQLKQDF